MSSPARSRSMSAFLGLACGDAYGRTLEFLRGHAVRTRPVSMSSADCRWTDDTHMALYLADAVLQTRGAFDADRFGAAWGANVVRWLHDPLTPSTAPGNTCLAGARAFERHGDWRRSGVPTSKGCGAVMRIAPLPMAFSDETLTEAARISAVLTHGHPDAVASAEALCWLLREVLEGAALDAACVGRIAARSRAAGHPAVVADALDAAIAFASTDAAWLDEASIPDGDGGWMAPSCMGLAVAACLRWSDPATVIDRAARFDGDSDSVAAVAGMLAGAAHPDALPEAWVAALPERRRIERLVDALHGPTSRRDIRTSVAEPIHVAWVPRPGRRLGVTFLPGKRGDGQVSSGRWERDLDLDLAALRAAGVGAIVLMVEDHELAAYRVPDLPERAAAHGLVLRRLPTRDLHPPRLEDAEAIVGFVADPGVDGAVVLVCVGGLGRSGTAAACVLAAEGVAAREAIDRVRSVRPGALQNAHQEDFVRRFRQEVK